MVPDFIFSLLGKPWTTSSFGETHKVLGKLLYPLRMLYEIRNEDEKFLEEIKIFPNNNITELENYLKIE